MITHRQRVLAALKGNETDRIPWLPEINAYFAEHQCGVFGLDDPEIDPAIKIALKMNAASFLAAPFIKEELAPDVQREVIEGNGEIVERISTPHGILQSRQVYNESATTYYRCEYLIKGPQDYKAFEYYYNSRRFVSDCQGFQDAIAPVLDYGIVALVVPPTPYMDCIMSLVGIENTMFQLFDHRKEFISLLDAMHQKNCEYTQLLLDAPTIDIIRPIEDTSSMLSSPDTFEKLCKPHLQQYADIIHSRGQLFIPHMCGHLKDMLSHMCDLDIDGIEAVTPPPTGNCTAKMVRDQLGSNAIIIGGFDPTNFARESSEQVRQIVLETAMSMKNDTRYIFGHEEISPVAKWESLKLVPQVLEDVAKR
jgi:hypothetical protein